LSVNNVSNSRDFYFFLILYLTIILWTSAFSETLVDLQPKVDSFLKHSEFKYELFDSAAIATFEEEWAVDVPYGARMIIRTNSGNIIAVLRSTLSRDCETNYYKPDYEEVINIYSSGGALLNSLSIGKRVVAPFYYQSDNGETISLITGGSDELVKSLIFDGSGKLLLSAYDLTLIPAPEGDYLVCKEDRRNILRDRAAIEVSGVRQKIEAGRFINLDGSIKEITFAKDIDEKRMKVLGVVDRNLLIFGGYREKRYSLFLYDVKASRVRWEINVRDYASNIAISGEDDKKYFLFTSSSDDKYFVHIVDVSDGRIISRLKLYAYTFLGLRDGRFAAICSSSRMESYGKKKFLILVFTPEGQITNYGLIFPRHGLSTEGFSGNFVYGTDLNVTLGSTCYPLVTAVYNISPGENSQADSFIVDPVIFEGIWSVDEIRDSAVVLVGQINPDDRLRKIVVERSLLEKSRNHEY